MVTSSGFYQNSKILTPFILWGKAEIMKIPPPHTYIHTLSVTSNENGNYPGELMVMYKDRT